MRPLVCADAFDALPARALDAAYRRMRTVASGAADAPRQARLSRADRIAVVEILRDTKPNLPDFFQGDIR